MQQRWWLVAVAVIGVGLAVLLIPRPDTGSDIPEPVPAAPAPPPVARPAVERIPGPPPGAEKVIAQRNRPSAQASKKLAAPWGGIRRKLGGVDTPAAGELAGRIKEVQQKFADLPGNVDADIDAIIAEAEPIVADLKAGYMSDADIKALVEVYEKGVSDWKNSAEPQEE